MSTAVKSPNACSPFRVATICSALNKPSAMPVDGQSDAAIGSASSGHSGPTPNRVKPDALQQRTQRNLEPVHRCDPDHSALLERVPKSFGEPRDVGQR